MAMCVGKRGGGGEAYVHLSHSSLPWTSSSTRQGSSRRASACSSSVEVVICWKIKQHFSIDKHSLYQDMCQNNVILVVQANRINYKPTLCATYALLCMFIIFGSLLGYCDPLTPKRVHMQIERHIPQKRFIIRFSMSRSPIFFKMLVSTLCCLNDDRSKLSSTSGLALMMPYYPEAWPLKK